MVIFYLRYFPRSNVKLLHNWLPTFERITFYKLNSAKRDIYPISCKLHHVNYFQFTVVTQLETYFQSESSDNNVP